MSNRSEREERYAKIVKVLGEDPTYAQIRAGTLQPRCSEKLSEIVGEHILPLLSAFRQVYISVPGFSNAQVPLHMIRTLYSVGDIQIGRLSPPGANLLGDVGTGKTVVASAMALIAGDVIQIRRAQGAKDANPRDITGYELLRFNKDRQKWEPYTMFGPVFGHFIILDEMNRFSETTQGALLEAIGERQVTIAGKTHELPRSTCFFGTGNPVESKGANTVIQALSDRMGTQIVMEPYGPEELYTVRKGTEKFLRLELPIIIEDPEEIGDARQYIYEHVKVPDLVEKCLAYVAGRVNLQDVFVPLKKLSERYLDGDSPFSRTRCIVSGRFQMHTMHQTKVVAAMNWREHVLIDDILSVAHLALAHRIGYKPALINGVIEDIRYEDNLGRKRRFSHAAAASEWLTKQLVEEGVREWLGKSGGLY
jgi:MoxR-like ATPase